MMTITVYGGWLTVFGDDGIHRPILNINTPSSWFSRARFIKSTSKIAERILKNIDDVTIEVEENVRGDIMFLQFENKIVVPRNYAGASYL